MKASEKFKDFRKKKRLSQQEIADCCGISKQAVSQWELGLTRPTDEMKIKIHNKYKFPYAVFFDDSVKDS